MRLPAANLNSRDMSRIVKSHPKLGALSYVINRDYQTDDSLRRRFVRDRSAGAKSLFRKDLKGHYGCVNAIEFSNNGGEWIVSGDLIYLFIC